ncbi:MAG: sensor histidine kinase, partial [Candidatus Binatia bacterium]
TPPAVSLRRQISVSIPLGLAFALVVIIFVYASLWEQRRVKLEFERRTDNLTQALKENFDNYVDVLYAIDSFFASSAKVERQEFKNFVSRLLLRHPGIRALSWNPSIQDTQRTALEEAARRDGFSGFQVTERNSQERLVRAGRRDEYIPVYYIEPYARNESALGFDVASDPVVNEALNRARHTGKPTATNPITLVQDIDRELGFLVFLPIYRYGLPSPEERRLTLQGYAIGAFRISDMVQASLKSVEAKGIEVRLYDDMGGEKKHLLYSSQALESKALPLETEQLIKPAALQRLTPFVVAGRRWIVQYTPTKEYLVAQRPWPAWGVPAGGLLFTAFLGAFLLVVTGHTAELQTINRELQKEIMERKRGEEATRKLNAELETANKELESFSYSVSHDLRAPLRSINGFSQALVDDYGEKLDAQAKDYIQRVRTATLRMDQLIHDLLQLSRVTRSEMQYEMVDLSRLGERIAAELRESGPRRKVEFAIEPELKANGDPRLLRVVLENLFNNAWKFTEKAPQPKIEFGVTEHNGSRVYFIRDNGAGFDMAYADKLFGAFQRLHNAAEYPGTGVGLATVQRIIHRHGGQLWAEGVVTKGATFYFVLP